MTQRVLRRHPQRTAKTARFRCRVGTFEKRFLLFAIESEFSLRCAERSDMYQFEQQQLPYFLLDFQNRRFVKKRSPKQNQRTFSAWKLDFNYTTALLRVLTGFPPARFFVRCMFLSCRTRGRRRGRRSSWTKHV